MSYYRKRKSTLTKKEQRTILKIIFWFIIFAVPFVMFIGLLAAFQVPDTIFPYLIIPFSIAEGVFLAIYNSPSAKGKRGEKRIAKILEKQAKKENGYVINDVIIPDVKGDKTSQIDHVYISKNTIACIETKNYSGRVYGNQDDREWTQVLNYGKVKNRLYNPEMQNFTHISRMSELTGINHKLISNIVVFVKGNIDYITCDHVYTPRGLKNFLRSQTEEKFYDETVKKVYQKLLTYKDNPIQTTKEHIQEIKKMQKDVNNNICPRCGGELVVRTGKDGSKFLGCKNYPRCKFTKKL